MDRTRYLAVLLRQCLAHALDRIADLLVVRDVDIHRMDELAHGLGSSLHQRLTVGRLADTSKDLQSWCGGVVLWWSCGERR